MRRHFLLSAVGAMCIAILIVLLKRPTNLPADSTARQRLLYHSAPRIKNHYEAPCHLCDNPTCVPDEYFVFLRQGYSLEQHKQAVGDRVDLHSAIEYIFPETANYGLYYSAELQNASLAVVRADIGVDMVECNLWTYLIE